MMKIIKNEKGNTMIFIIGLFGVFFLMFTLIMSFANVFIEKEHASNNAEQASIVASGILLDRLEDAIDEYDRWLAPLLMLDPLPSEIIGLELLGEQVEDKINQLPDTLTDSEKKHQAINQVLKKELGNGNRFLKPYVEGKLGDAEKEIIGEVRNNIEKNNGQISETEITFNQDNRIEVETATRYEAFKFDEYLSENQRHVKQTGQGPTFDFADSLSWNWNYPY